MRLSKTFLAILLVFIGTATIHARPRDSGVGINVSRRGYAVFGADVVAYYSLKTGADSAEGVRGFTYEWRGATWLFSSQENLEAFVLDPESYAPQYGGYCANAMAQNAVVESDPDAWHLRDGRLYLFNRKKGRADWLEDVTTNIAQADGNWPDHLARLSR